MTPRDHFLAWFKPFFLTWGIKALAGSLTVVLILAEYLNWSLLVTVFAVLFQVLLLGSEAWVDHQKLKEEQARAELLRQRDHSLATIQRSLERILKCLAEDVDSYTTCCRFSLYCHDDSSSSFIQIARISNDPALRKEGRSQYPDNEGHIALCWRLETTRYEHAPEDPTEWFDEMQQLLKNAPKYVNALPKDVVKSMTMRARSAYYARIDVQGKPIGMLVVEHEQPDGLGMQFGDRLREARLFGILGEIVLLARDDLLTEQPAS